MPDVIKALNLDILVVADAGLGTINSTVLTCEKKNGLLACLLLHYEKIQNL